jgi:hypothetical protein
MRGAMGKVLADSLWSKAWGRGDAPRTTLSIATVTWRKVLANKDSRPLLSERLPRLCGSASALFGPIDR